MLSLLKSILFLSLALFFAIGYQYAQQNRRDFYSGGVETIAVIDSIEGQFLKGRKIKGMHYNYWIIFDNHRYHYQWPEKYNVGDKIRVIYDPERPSKMKPTSRIDNNKESEWKVFLLFGVAFPVLFLWLSFSNFRSYKEDKKI